MHNSGSAAAAYDYPLLIKHLLHTPLFCAPDQEIVSGSGARYSYRTFRKRIGRLARGLTTLGVRAGDTVAVMDWDSHRYLESFFAVPMMGATLHTINVRLSPEQILYTINHAGDDIILAHADFAQLLDQIADRFERPVAIVLLQDGPAVPEPPARYDAEYETLLAASDGDFDFADFDERRQATTFYTTGTTGDPKGVAYSHRQIVLHTLGLLAGFGHRAGAGRFHDRDVYMPMTPMFHVHAWGFPYAATLAGLKQVYGGRPDPESLLHLIDREAVTFTHCVPTVLRMLLDAAAARSTDLSRLKAIIGGSALSPGLARAACEQGIDVMAAYGMSESCPFLSAADGVAGEGDSGISTRCNAGKPGPLVELRVVDSDMINVPRDGTTTGEVVVRAPWLVQGYVKNPEGSSILWRGGYLHTGDVGRISAAGALQITDRLKDVIKSGGEWISSLELEDIASGCRGIREVAAIGIPDRRWGERPMLIVVRSADTGTAVRADEIRDRINQDVADGRIPKWAVPDRIEFVKSLPRTSVGKVDKKALRARYGACSE